MDMHTMFSTMLGYMKNDKKEQLNTAVSGDDTGQMYRVANDIIETSNCFPNPNFFHLFITDNRKKKPEKSDQMRNAGNEHYAIEGYRTALLCYIKALSLAPKGSREMKLAYSNISAVTYAFKAYKASIKNIDACLAMGCNGNLKNKLEKRKKDAQNFIKNSQEQIDVGFLKNFLKFEAERNVDVPSVSAQIQIDVGKKVIAGEDVPSGTLVAIEQAFMTSTADMYFSCYYCNSMRLFFIPCDNCEALFCSEECKTKCMEEYHRIECQIFKYLGSLFEKMPVRLITRTAIKMSLMLGWDEFIKASSEMGTKRLKKASVQEAFDWKNPLSPLSFDEDKGPRHAKLYMSSLIFAVVVDALSYVKDYFPSDYTEEEKAKEAMGSVMINLYGKFTKGVEITSPAYDFKEGEYKDRASRNLGLFSFTSKLKHSCEPNLLVLGMNDRVALVAVKKIKKGEELTISYIDNFEDIHLKHTCVTPQQLLRQRCLLSTLNFTCECRVCIENLDFSFGANCDIDRSKITRQQLQAHDEVIKTLTDKTTPWERRIAVAGNALDHFTGPNAMTIYRFSAHKYLQAILQICQLVQTNNVAYGVNVSSSYGEPSHWPMFKHMVNPSMFE